MDLDLSALVYLLIGVILLVKFVAGSCCGGGSCG